MKSILAVLRSVIRASTKKRSVGTIQRLEERAVRHLSPFDKTLIGFFVMLMALGAFMLFAKASTALSVEVPVKGGTHIEGVIGTPRFINPLLATSETDRDLAELVFTGLLRAKPDGGLALGLAEHYEVSPDGLSYTFTLRSNATFHDGKPVTAEDVVFSVQAAKNPEIKSPRRANWEGVEVVALDEKTVIFSLKAPYSLFLENTTMGILPKHLWQNIRPEEFPFSEHNIYPVGAGPFRVDSIKKNSSGVPIEYRLLGFDAAPHAPYIKTFIFKFFQSQEELVQALTQGDIHAAHSLTLPTESQSITLHEAVFGRVFGVFFNQNQKQLFADEAVRRALDVSLDKKLIVDTILSGYGTPLSGPLPPTDVAMRRAGSEEKDTGTIEEAQTILASAGWEKDETGVYVKGKESERMSFALTTGNVPELRSAAELVAESWRTLGAEVTVQYFDTNDLNLEVIRPRKYDALLFGEVIGRELDLFPFWHASQRNDPGLNVALYANIVTDSLLEEARAEENPTVRREKAAAAAEEIAEDSAAVFLYAPHFLYLTEKELRGVNLGAISTPSDRFYGVENWYLKTERLWHLFQ